MSAADAEIVQTLARSFIIAITAQEQFANTLVGTAAPHPLSMAPQYPLAKTFLVAAWLEVERSFSE
jgi:hypothetical protein